LKYEELHEIRKMTRRGYQESRREEENRVVVTRESEDDERRKIVKLASELGYGPDEVGLLPEGIDVFEGCGNPLAAIDIKPGSVVLVAGCRSGADCFLAAVKAGQKGRVVGVEESPDDVTLAREAARSLGAGAVEIRPGEVENIPAADKSFDVVVTNCAISFSYDKPRVLKELARVLRPGGRLLLCEPAFIKKAAAAKRRVAAKGAECLENAFVKEDIKAALKRAGLKKTTIVEETAFPVSRLLRDRRVQASIAAGDLIEEEAAAWASMVLSVKTIAVRP
jgi:arsenite methyltransferase